MPPEPRRTRPPVISGTRWAWPADQLKYRPRNAYIATSQTKRQYIRSRWRRIMWLSVCKITAGDRLPVFRFDADPLRICHEADIFHRCRIAAGQYHGLGLVEPL